MSTAPYLIGTNTDAGTTNTVIITSGHATAAGDKIEVAVGMSAGTLTSVTDSVGNTYVTKQNDAGGLGPSTYKVVADGATTILPSGGTITIKVSSTTALKSVAAIGCPGLATTAYDVGANADAASGPAMSVTSPTLSQAAETVVAILTDGNTGGIPTGIDPSWTVLVSGIAPTGGPHLTVLAKTVSATTAVTAAATISSTKWAALIGTYKQATVTVTVSPTTLPDGQVTVHYDQFMSASGGTSYTWSSTTPPAGLTFSTAGELSGIPTAAGTFPVTFTATDVSGAHGQVTINIVIDPAPVVTNPGLVGANVPPAAFGTTVTQAQAIADWLSLISPRRLTARRVFYGVGGTPAAITTDLQADVAAGRKVCMSLKPGYNPTSPADLAAIDTFLQSCVNGGLSADVCIWGSPYNSGLTAAQYIAAVQYYGPTIRKYYSLVFVEAVADVANNGAGAFYPGDAYVDKVAGEYWYSDFNAGLRLDQMQAIADNASPPKPFGLWSFNATLTP